MHIYYRLKTEYTYSNYGRSNFIIKHFCHQVAPLRYHVTLHKCFYVMLWCNKTYMLQTECKNVTYIKSYGHLCKYISKKSHLCRQVALPGTRWRCRSGSTAEKVCNGHMYMCAKFHACFQKCTNILLSHWTKMSIPGSKNMKDYRKSMT